jgi:hypothetical protein
MIGGGTPLSDTEKKALEHAQSYLTSLQKSTEKLA